MNINFFKRNKPFWIGVLIGIIGISVIIIGFEVYKPEPETTHFATHDIGISGTSNDPLSDNTKITYDLTTVHFGSSQTGTTNPRRRGFIMRFDLKDKPSSWETCEISLYLYSEWGGRTSASVYLFAGNWTEEDWDGSGSYMEDFEIYWSFEDSVGTISNNNAGFRRVSITDYINNITTETFSIAVYPRRLENYDCSGSIYSSEWDGTDPLFPYVLPENDSYTNYLPQLFWS